MDDRLEYQTKLLEAILQTSIENKTIGIQNTSYLMIFFQNSMIQATM